MDAINQQNGHSNMAVINQQNGHSNIDVNQQNGHSSMDVMNQQNGHSNQDCINQKNVQRSQDINKQHNQDLINLLNAQGNQTPYVHLANNRQDHPNHCDVNNQQKTADINAENNNQQTDLSSNQRNGCMKDKLNRRQLGSIQGNSDALPSNLGKQLTSLRNIRNGFVERQRRKCGKGFPFKISGGRFGEYLRSCAKCKKRFKTTSNLVRHVIMTHRKGKRHRHAQLNRKLIECDKKPAHCRKNLASDRNVNLVSPKRQRKRRRHQCVKCKKTFIFQSNLLRHLKTHGDKTLLTTSDSLNSANEPLNRRQCEPCGESFNPIQSGNHSSTTEWKCKENTSLTNTKELNNVHQTRTEKQESVQCEQYYETFNLEPQLNVHMEKLHDVIANRGNTDQGSDGKMKKTQEPVFDTNNNDQDDRLECEMCDKSFRRKSHLNSHKKAAHSADNILHCVHCGKNFINKHNYHNHVMTHVIRECPAKPDVMSHGTPEGAAVAVDDVTREPSENESQHNGLTIPDDQYDDIEQLFPGLLGVSEFLQPISYSDSASLKTASDSHSAASNIPPAGKQSREKEPYVPHTVTGVTMETNQQDPMEQSPALAAEVTIEYQQQTEDKTEAETVIRGYETELNRKQSGGGSDVITFVQQTSPRQENNSTVTTPAQGQGEILDKSLETKFVCDLCDQEFTEEIDLTAHREILHSIQCTRCCESFPDSSSFVQHVIKDCKNRAVVDEDVKDKSQHFSKDHKTQDRNNEKTFQCNVCEGFMTESPLEEHMKEYITGKAHRCIECDETFITKWAFTLHKQQHTAQREHSQRETCDGMMLRQDKLKNRSQNVEERRYKCDFCDATFRQNIALILHELDHGPQMTHQCMICDKVFKRRFTCELHMRTNHSGAQKILTNFHCGAGSKLFNTETDCTDHMKNCSDEQNQEHECTECGAVFLQESWLDEHRLTHSKNTGFKCRMCNDGFETADNLEHHTQTEHSMSFQCDKSNKSFIQKTSLVLHRRNHVLEERLRDPSHKRNHMLEERLRDTSHKRNDMLEERLRDPSLKVFLNCNTIKDGCPSLSDAAGQQWETCCQSFIQESSLTHISTHSAPLTERPSSATHCAQTENRRVYDRTFTDVDGQHSLLAIPLMLKSKDFKCLPRKKCRTFKLRHFNHGEKGKHYQCDDCKKSFRQKSNLARHLQMNNMENHHKCGRCRKVFFTTMKYCKH